MLQASFYFIFPVLIGSEPVQRYNKQSKKQADRSVISE